MRTTIRTVPGETAAVLVAIRKWLEAICATRPDGAALIAKIINASGQLRVVMDERDRFITVGISATERGGPVEWIETVNLDVDDETARGFGALLTQDDGMPIDGRMH